MQPRYGGTVIFGGLTDVKNLDNIRMTSLGDSNVDFQFYDHLLALGQDMAIEPGLAEDWEISSDGKDITFRLRRGVKFHDGTDFNAQAVKFHFDRLLDPDGFGRARTDYERMMNSVEIVDEYAVIFHLKNPARPFFTLLARSPAGGGIVSPAAAEKYGEDFNSNPVGTGPFKFQEWAIDNRLVMVRNEDYWREGLPYLDVVRYILVLDRSVQVAMVRTGDLDVQDNILPAHAPLLEGSPSVRLLAYPSGRFHAIRVSVDRPPWDNSTLRQALAYAVDRQAIVDVLLSGNGRPAYTPEGDGFWWSAPDLKPYTYDPTRAKELLAEAGYPNGITVDWWASATTDNIKDAEVHQAILEESGINLNINTVPSTDKWQMVVTRQIHMNSTSWTPRPDPDGRLRILYHSQGSFNYSGYSDPQVDALIDQAATIYDQLEAKKLYDQIQEKIVRDVGGYVFTWFGTEFTGLNERVRGYEDYADRRIRFFKTWVER